MTCVHAFLLHSAASHPMRSFTHFVGSLLPYPPQRGPATVRQDITSHNEETIKKKKNQHTKAPLRIEIKQRDNGEDSMRILCQLKVTAGDFHPS